jgi:hypothetical protein
LRQIVGEHGSFQAWVDAFLPRESDEHLLRLKHELERRLRGVGEKT